MSALEELWLWLQGRRSQTGTTSTMHHSHGKQQPSALPDDAVQVAQSAMEKAAETQARVQRNNRYRAGPWQMK